MGQQMLSYMALTYIWTPSITKLAMLAFYHRINPFFPFRIGLYVIALLVLVYSFVFTYYFCGPCNPLSVGSGTCLNNVAMAHAVLNIVSDVVIIAFPIPMIHRLHMPFKQRLLVGLILGVGSAYVNLKSIYSLIRSS